MERVVIKVRNVPTTLTDIVYKDSNVLQRLGRSLQFTHRTKRVGEEATTNIIEAK